MNLNSKFAVTQSRPPTMRDEAFHGPIGNLIKKISPHVEMNSESILLQLLVRCAAAIGARPHLQLGSNLHKLNLFALQLAETAQGKGETGSLVENIIKLCDPNSFGIVDTGGMVSGQGLIEAFKRVQPTNENDLPPPIFISEEEFASALKAKKGEGNSLSPTIRKMFDGKTLESLGRSKNQNHLLVTNYYVNIVAHITPQEYRQETNNQTDHSNGFSNRFIFGHSHRVRLLPKGQSPLSFVDVSTELSALKNGILFGQAQALITRDAHAEKYWVEIYGDLTAPNSEFSGMLARGRVYVMKLAGQFALLDQHALIRGDHLIAAKAVWDYSVDVVNWLMSNPGHSNQYVALAAKIHKALLESPNGLPRAHVSRILLGRNYSSDDIELIRHLLESEGRIYTEMRTGGSSRPTEMWFAYPKSAFESEQKNG